MSNMFTQLLTFSFSLFNIGPILDDRLKEKILETWKPSVVSLSVCVSVGMCVNGVQGTPFDLGT